MGMRRLRYFRRCADDRFRFFEYLEREEGMRRASSSLWQILKTPRSATCGPDR